MGSSDPISLGLWVHHMFTTGLPGISLGLFWAASEAVAIPTGVQIFCFIATFMLGGLTGVMVALASFDFQAHDTLFVVAHHVHPEALMGAFPPVPSPAW